MKIRVSARIMILFAIIIFSFPPNPVLANSLAIRRSLALSSVFAKAQNQDCSNLDVVFIVDQSWSMSAPGTSEASDPLNQRKFAVDAMIDLLTGLALDQCPGTYHRMAVISYGTSAHVDLELYDINPSTADQANILRDENGIKKQIVADNLGGNNPEAAFTEAWKMWRNVPSMDDMDGNRKKVIIFFTNGISNTKEDYAKGAETVKNRVATMFPYDENLLKLENCLSDLRKQSEDGYIAPEVASKCMTANPLNEDEDAYENSTYIWTVFLKPPGYQQYVGAYNSLINNYREMSKAHGGDAIELKPNSRQDIPSTFRRILSSLAGVKPVLLNCGDFAVNPYLSEARITVYTIDSKNKITLSYVDQSKTRHEMTAGQPNPAGGFDVKDYYVYGANESYILSYPYAGIWQLTADTCDGIDAYYEQVDINSSRVLGVEGVIPQYEVEPFYDPEHPYYLEYELRDSKTGTLVPQAEHSRFKVDVKASVTFPSGEVKDYTLIWDAATQVFRSPEPLLVSSAGMYGVHMIGTTYKREGNPSPLETVNPELVFAQSFTLFDINTQFEVAAVTPFTIDIEYPPSEGTIKNVHDLSFDRWTPLVVAPLPVRVRLLDRSGNMIMKPDEYLASTQGVFTAQVEGEERTSETITLQPDPDNPGYFTGEIPNFEVVGGEQDITVTMDESAMLKDKRPYNREVESDFSRADNLFHTPAFWQFLLLAIIVYVIVSVIVYFASRTNKVSGTLVFQDGSVTIAEFNLVSGKNWRVIGTRELKNYPHLELKKIKVTNSSRKRTPAAADGEFTGTSFDGNTQPGIHVSCVALDGKRGFDDELTPEYPRNYGSTPFTMMYQPLYKQ